MRIPVHSPWLPGYINVAQIVLVILIVAGLFGQTHILYLKGIEVENFFL